MKDLLAYLETVEDRRQQRKVRHKMGDIIALVFFASIAGADDFVEIELFGKIQRAYLGKYLEMPNGIPSHDTIQRVIAMVSPAFLEKFQLRWNEMLSSNEGEKIKRILALDGKTQRGNGNRNQRANHIVSAVDERGFCLGQRRVDDKSNEITAMPLLLEDLNIKGHIITTDAMGTQTEIVKKIRKKRADYVLALKGNQGTLHGDVKLYFEDSEHVSGCAYTKTIEKARGGIETREYWQTADVSWLPQRKEWMGLKSIAMTRNTICKDGKETRETRYFISSLPLGVEDVARAIRGHWMVESYHWHLDVTFHEDDNHTLEKQAAMNLNIIRKWTLNILRLFEVLGKPLSMKKKRFVVGLDPQKYLEMVLAL